MININTPSKISVAMCTYNGARHLQEQLDTIAAQSRRPYELIVSDDRSTDDTIQILREFSRRSVFPVQIYENPVQLGSTRNFDKTMRLCNGDLVALSDQDDRWSPDKLLRMGEFLEQNPEANMVFTDATLIDSSSQPTGKTLWHSFRFMPAVRMRFLKDPGSVLLERPVVTGATMMFRRSLLSHFDSIPATWVHDGWITWMSALWGRPLFIEQTLTDYRIHDTQQLGVGKASLLGRIQEIRQKQRNIYSRFGKDFYELVQYLEQEANGLPDERKRLWQQKMERAAAFFKMRAEAPATFGARLLFLGRHLKAYRALSAPTWRILMRDLMMGNPTNP